MQARVQNGTEDGDRDDEHGGGQCDCTLTSHGGIVRSIGQLDHRAATEARIWPWLEASRGSSAAG
jgi:hypothetical protein